MIQEEILENELNEEEIKTDKTRKVSVIIVILLLFCATYYYYYNVSKQNPALNPDYEVMNQSVEPSAVQKVKTEIKPDITKQDIAKKDEKPVVNTPKPVQNDVPKTTINPNNIIRPSNKMNLIRLAAIAAGKPDPFKGSDIRASYDLRSPRSGGYSKFNSLPPPPTSIGNLPTIGELPKINFPQGQSPYKMQDPDDLISIKGFWGDKVIVSVNGVTESLGTNQSFQGIKVVNIDPDGHAAKFKKDGKTITRRIKDLSELEDKSDLRLVKDLNR